MIRIGIVWGRCQMMMDGWLAMVVRWWITWWLGGSPLANNPSNRCSPLQAPLNSRWDLNSNSNSNSILTAGFSLILIEIVPFVRLGYQVVSFWLTDLQLAIECALSNYLWSGNEQKKSNLSTWHLNMIFVFCIFVDMYQIFKQNSNFYAILWA